jgi:glycosyltransferase involved in cell wall biosynthesis
LQPILKSKLPNVKILIDDGLSGAGNMSGIGRFTVSLATHLKNISDCDITRYTLLHKVPRYFRKWSYIGVCNIPGVYKNYDLVHHLANYVPCVRGKNKHVLTVHDLSVLYYPETVSLAWRHYNAVSFKKSVQRADAIITVSKSIRDEILATFPTLDKSLVFVGHPGIQSSILVANPKEIVVTELGVKPFSYFLFIGDLTKRKNLEFALRAFREAKQNKHINEKTEFVVVGMRGWGYSAIKELINSDASIKTLGYLSDEQIVSLYRYAKAFVYPSIYEGFGIPLVEAISQGTPIIISNIPTSAEINDAHHNQMFCFQLGDRNGLIALYENIDKNFLSIRDRLNYGDISEYTYESVAACHLNIYSEILDRV